VAKRYKRARELIKERCGKALQESKSRRGVGKGYKRAIRAHNREVWESATREQLELIQESCRKALYESN